MRAKTKLRRRRVLENGPGRLGRTLRRACRGRRSADRSRRYIDDLGVKPGTLHAAILRSPHAHADILSFNVEAARALPGVVAVLIGSDVADITGTLVSSVRTPIEARAIALERVRYVGEPVAIAVAADRYQAEDALDLIEVEYRQRSAVVDPEAALVAGAPLLHDKVGSNLVSRSEE